MAKVVEFDRFKVIKASAKEMFEAVGSPGVCDFCSERPEHGYYIAMLNKWYCPKCWEEFKKRAMWHPEDAMIEDRNFTCYGLVLGLLLPQVMIDDGCEIIQGVRTVYKGFHNTKFGSVLDYDVLINILLIKYKSIVFTVSRRLLKSKNYMTQYWAAIKPHLDKLQQYDSPPA